MCVFVWMAHKTSTQTTDSARIHQIYNPQSASIDVCVCELVEAGWKNKKTITRKQKKLSVCCCCECQAAYYLWVEIGNQSERVCELRNILSLCQMISLCVLWIIAHFHSFAYEQHLNIVRYTHTERQKRWFGSRVNRHTQRQTEKKTNVLNTKCTKVNVNSCGRIDAKSERSGRKVK